MLHVTVDQNIPYNKVTSAYGGASVMFKEAWESGITHELGSHSFPTYMSTNLFNKNPNWGDGFKMSFNRPFEYLQKYGVQVRYVREAESETLLEGSYLWNGVDECGEAKGFFNECKGKWKQFLSPTWQKDVVVTGAISASDDYLTIEDIEYSAYWSANTSIGKYLYILFPDGTGICREVTGWPTDTRINLDSAIGEDIGVEALPYVLVSFLLPCRFNIDELEMRYYKPFVAESNARMQSLHDLALV
jgi:hypothetical protein